jgi:hypothetical protein
MKKILFIFLLTSAPYFCLSQKCLVSLKNSNLVLENFNFYIDTIIDAREDKYCIGALQLDQDKVTPLYLETDFKKEMNFLFAPYFKKDATKKPLIIKLNRLFITNYKRQNDYNSVTEMNITFLTKKKDQYYEYLTVGKYYIGGKNKCKNITSLTKQIISEFSLKYKAGVLYALGVSKDSIVTSPAKDKNYKIFETQKYPLGIFWTFEDFLDFRPDTTTTFKYHVQYNNDKSSLIAQMGLVNSNKEIADLWGFSDGENIYARLQNNFYRIEKNGKNFILTYSNAVSRDHMFAATFFFGIIGGFVTYELESTRGPLTGSGNYYLDFLSSQFKSKYDLSNCKAEAYNIFYYSDLSNKNGPVTIIYNDSALCKLSPSEYYLLKTQSNVKQFEIKLKQDTSVSTMLINPILFNFDVYTFKLNKDKEIAISKSYGDIKSSVIDKINKGLIKSPCLKE